MLFKIFKKKSIKLSHSNNHSNELISEKCQSNPTLSRLIYDYQNNQKTNQQQHNNNNNNNNLNKINNKNRQQIYLQGISNIHNSPSSRLTNNLTQKSSQKLSYYDNSNKQRSYFNTPINIKHSFLIQKQKQNKDLYQFKKNKQVKFNKSYLNNSNNLCKLKENQKCEDETSYDQDETQENSRKMKVVRLKDKQFRFNSPENYKVVYEDYQGKYNNTNQKAKSNKNNKHINLNNNNNNKHYKKSSKYAHNRNLTQAQICQKQSMLSLCRQLKQIQNSTHRPATSINYCPHQHINCPKLTDQKLMYLRMIQKYQKQNILLGIENKKLQNQLIKKQQNQNQMKSKIYELMFQVEKLKRENQKFISRSNKNIMGMKNYNHNHNYNLNQTNNDHKNIQKRVKKFNQISQNEQRFILQTQQKQQTQKNINILTNNHKNDQSLFEISKSPSKFYDLQISAFDSMFVPPMSKNQKIQELQQMFQKLLQKSLQAKGNQKVQIRQKLAQISDQMKRLRQK